MKLFYIFLFVSFFVSLNACNSKDDKNSELPEKKEIEEKMIGANRLLLGVEEQEILDFIDRYNWDVKETGSGLKYDIYHHGNGKKAEEGLTAVINYEISLLTGDLVYSSEEEGNKAFKIGKGGEISGLQEGILLMRVGDKARFIMPPHLAHGVPGDGVKIPKRVPIVYKVELIDLL
ncbi:MAG: FKBP-type peptidyl-prolyl cis-trans isomerase [Bacteroidota bacterium]